MNFSSSYLESRDRRFVLFCAFEFEWVNAIGELLLHLLPLFGCIRDGYLGVRVKPCVSALVDH